MAKPTATVTGLNHVSGALRRAAQERGRAGRDRANALLDQGPARLNRIEVVGVGREELTVAPAASISVRTRGALCAARLSSTTMSPGRRWRTRCRRTQATKRGVVMAPHAVASVTQPSRRIAPTRLRLSPQLRGRGSINSCPRGSHACDRPIARFAPDSSRKTSRSAAIVWAQARNAARSAWTRARSCSAGRDCFFCRHTRSAGGLARCWTDAPGRAARRGCTRG